MISRFFPVFSTPAKKGCPAPLSRLFKKKFLFFVLEKLFYPPSIASK
jgi:hypothetical protein